MSKPKSRDELIEWCFRKLGAPMLAINVTEEQSEDRIEEALEKYYQHHSDAVEEVMYVHTVTQDDIDNKYITLPDSVMVVKGLIRNVSTGRGAGNFMSYEFQAHMSDIVNNISTGIVSYYMRRDYLELLQSFFNDKTTARYERHKHQVYLPIDWVKEFEADESHVILKLSMKIDGEDYNDVWNDDWLRRYSTELIKYQWARNTSKFQSIQLLGGVTIDSDKLLQDAKEEIEKLEKELRDVHEEPPDAFWLG